MVVTVTLFLFCDGLLEFLLLWHSITRLMLYRKKHGTALLPLFSLGRIVGLLMLLPPLVILIIAVIYLFIVQSNFPSHFSQTFLMLGFWTIMTVHLFSLIISRSIRCRLPHSWMFGLLCGIGPVIYFSSFQSFEGLFGRLGPVGYTLPFLVGLFLTLICYPTLLRLYKLFH